MYKIGQNVMVLSSTGSILPEWKPGRIVKTFRNERDNSIRYVVFYNIFQNPYTGEETGNHGTFSDKTVRAG